TGTDTMAVSEATWKRHGIQILAQEYYERGTTEFYPIVTKLIQRKPDIIDLGATPPGDAGLIFKALGEQGWNGVKIVGAGTSSSELIKAAGRAADGVYLGLAPDFTGPTATPLQRDLETRAVKEIGEHLSAISISAWDAVMALKAAIEKAGTLDPDKLKDTIPNIVFESSYGPAAFGGAAYYKSVQQMLLPVTVTQIQGDKTVEVARVIPEELKQKVGAR
ncbi:MAG: ABC transporter substrate-binding protein, partial [Clostridia bacterium]|nr:ABC transporter substrate-binding protein [Clostridia bacterium]